MTPERFEEIEARTDAKAVTNERLRELLILMYQFNENGAYRPYEEAWAIELVGGAKADGFNNIARWIEDRAAKSGTCLNPWLARKRH